MSSGRSAALATGGKRRRDRRQFPRLRLLAGAVIWIALALAVAGTLLSALFRAHVERRQETELKIQLEQIAAALERPGAGQLILTHQPSDPRFREPYSG